MRPGALTLTGVPNRRHEAARQAPADLKIEVNPKGVTCRDLLLEGKIDAMVAPTITPMIAHGDPRVGRLWPNYREVETAYYRRTGFFPIMHVTTISSEIVAKHPWVVESLTLAFEEAKQLALVRLANPRNVPLAFVMAQREEERRKKAEDDKIALRNIRRDANELVKKALKENEE